MKLTKKITVVAALVCGAAALIMTAPAAQCTSTRGQFAEVVTFFWGLKALLAFAAKCVAVGAVVVTVAYLSWPKIQEFLRNRFQLHRPNRIALSMLEKLKTGEYRVCAVGIDKELDQVVGEAAIRSTEISPEVEAFYKNLIVEHSQERS